MREPFVAKAEVAAVSVCSELGLCVRVRELLLPVRKFDAEAALKVVESVPGGSEKEYGVGGHAELAELVGAADDALVDVVSLADINDDAGLEIVLVPLAVGSVVESVPGGRVK